MSRASGTSGSAVRMPGTSFHSTTRPPTALAPEAWPTSPCLVERRYAAVERTADEAGDNGDNARLQGRSTARAPRGVGQTRRCAAVMIVRIDHLERVDVDGAAARSRIAAVGICAGDTLAARPAGRSHVVRDDQAARRRYRLAVFAGRHVVDASSFRRAGRAGTTARTTSRWRRRNAAASRAASGPAGDCMARLRATCRSRRPLRMARPGPLCRATSAAAF